MYIVQYVFYKIKYDSNGQGHVYDVILREFSTPQSENSETSRMRTEGYFTKRVSVDIYKIISAVKESQS
jgi:hypothetical protein